MIAKKVFFNQPHVIPRTLLCPYFSILFTIYLYNGFILYLTLMQSAFFLKKRFFVALLSSLILGGVIVAYSASTPTFINYQGFITNSSGVAQSGSASVIVRVYDDPTSGVLLFEENEGTVTITNGYFTIPIGQVGDVNGSTAAVSLSDLDFDKAYYVTVEIGAPFSTGEMTLAGGSGHK